MMSAIVRCSDYDELTEKGIPAKLISKQSLSSLCSLERDNASTQLPVVRTIGEAR